MIKVIIFDFDGLIFDTETYELQSFQKLYDQYQCDFPTEKWMHSIGTHLAFDPYDKIITTYPGMDPENFRKERRKIYKTLTQNQLPREGVLDCFAQARDLGMNIALASSSSKAWIDKHLAQLNIHSFFDFVCTADDVKEVKPNPELYISVLEHFDIEPYEAMVLEDSPNGALAAIRANIPCVIVPNETTAKLTFDENVRLRLKSHNERTLQEILDILSI